MTTNLMQYASLLSEIKGRIKQAQSRAVFAVNQELIRLYWDIGHMLDLRQKQEGWGTGVIPRLARDIRNELPEIKGFSERNMGYMIRFAREYGNPAILQQAVAKLAATEPDEGRDPQKPLPEQPVSSLFLQIPWGHHILLLEKIKDLPTRHWYMQVALTQGWSRPTLTQMIRGGAHLRQGQGVNNFPQALPESQAALAMESLKDPYIFDFLTLREPFLERELETGLVAHLEKFLLELGQGFAFVGRQYLLSVDNDDYYIDLLFYHLRLRSFIVIELKRGAFKAEYAGKMNLYCNLVDDHLKHTSDQPTIGLILCQDSKRVLAEYALRGIDKPIGVSEYELTRALPTALQSALPSIEQIEAELGSEILGDEPPISNHKQK